MPHPILDSRTIGSVFEGVAFAHLENACDIQEESKWLEREISFAHDDINKLSNAELAYIKHIVSFPAISDQQVSCNLMERFMLEVKDPSALKFLAFQNYMELVHARTYGLMLKAICANDEEFKKLSDPNREFAAIARKTAWVEKWTKESAPFEERLIAFIIIEGLFFSSLFCGFYWLKNRGSKLPGMIQSNELISRDETMHWEFTLIMLMLCPKDRLPSIERVCEMFKEAVSVESDFVDESLPEPIFGMNAESMKRYVKFIADFVLRSVSKEVYNNQIEPIYKIDNPFNWMEALALPVMTSFFERRHTQYRSAEALVYEEDIDLDVDI